MTDEETNEQEETPQEETQEQEHSETELEAMRQGWDPNFEGDENKRALSAEEYLDRKPLYDRLHKQERKARELEEAIEEFRKYHEKTREREYNRAMEDLKKEKKEALENEDYDSAVEVDDRIRKTEQEYQQAQQPEQTSDNRAFQEFRERNPWYDNDKQLKRYADGAGVDIVNENPNLSLEEIYSRVEQEIKQAFPQKFKNPTPQVESGTSSKRGQGKKAKSIKDLGLDSSKEHSIRKFIERVGMSEEEYVKSIELENQ